MKFFNFLIPILFCLGLITCRNEKREAGISKGSTVVTQKESVFKVIPIQHATLVLEWNDIIIYVDPVGGKRTFENQKPADLILITDTHSDHFSLETLQELNTAKAKIMVPQNVADSIPSLFTPQLDVLDHGSKKERFSITVEAIPLNSIDQVPFNLRQKGRGNGYLMEMNGERMYISGATKDIPDLQALKHLDKAFVCMNLSNTMTIEDVADLILKYKPKEVYPYHYQGTHAFNNVLKFKALVNQANKKIKVNLLDWYLW